MYRIFKWNYNCFLGFLKAMYFSFKISDKTIVFIGHFEIKSSIFESEEAKQTLAISVM